MLFQILWSQQTTGVRGHKAQPQFSVGTFLSIWGKYRLSPFRVQVWVILSLRCSPWALKWNPLVFIILHPTPPGPATFCFVCLELILSTFVWVGHLLSVGDTFKCSEVRTTDCQFKEWASLGSASSLFCKALVRGSKLRTSLFLCRLHPHLFLPFLPLSPLSFLPLALSSSVFLSSPFASPCFSISM